MQFFQLSSELSSHLNDGGTIDVLNLTPTIVSMDASGALSLSSTSISPLTTLDTSSFIDMPLFTFGNDVIGGYSVYEIFNSFGFITGTPLEDVTILMNNLDVFENYKLIKVIDHYYIVTIMKIQVDNTTGTPLAGSEIGANGFLNYNANYIHVLTSNVINSMNVFNEGNIFLQAYSYNLTIENDVLKLQKNNERL